MFTRVPPQWPKTLPARLAFVGMAPSERELETGLPLTGPSGRVFDQLLATANIPREECLVTNLFDEQAPANDIAPWIKEGGERLARNLARLEAELRKAGANVVVPMGSPVLWAFTGVDVISKARGAVCRATRIVPGTKLLPSFHPAHVLREWSMFPTTAADFVKADAEAARGPKLFPPRVELWLEPTLADLDYFRDKFLRSANPIAVDIETSVARRQITCVGFGADDQRAICVPFCDERKPSGSYWSTLDQELAAWRWVREVCNLPARKLLQNGTYDAYWLWTVMGIPLRNYSEDTRLLHHALYPELPKDLAFMGACYTNQGPWKLMNHHSDDKRFG